MRGFGIAPFYGVQYSLPSDAIEYGHWKTGVRVEGLMFSSMSMGQKAGSGFTSAIMGAILSMAAFDGLKATAAEQSQAAVEVIKNFYLYVPIALWVIMFAIAACYRLDKKYDQMMRELMEREGNLPQEELAAKSECGQAEERDSNKVNIAIGRLYGSDGRKVAEALAREYGVRLYDRQIICLLAEKLGMENADLDGVTRLLDSYNYQKSSGIGMYPQGTPLAAGDYGDAQMFIEQSKIMTQLAKQEPGVFLGRCSNVVLKNIPHTYSFFLYAEDDFRVREGLEKDTGESLQELKERDKMRDEYYRRFTGYRRDDASQYDMVINVGRTGVDQAVELIKEYIRIKEKSET